MLLQKQDLLNAIEITKAGYEGKHASLAHLRVVAGFAWATDGHRVIKFPVVMEDGNSTDEVFIHFKDLKAILKRGKPVKVKGCNHYVVSCEDVIVSPEWKYPDLSRFYSEIEFTAVSLDFRTKIDKLLNLPLLKNIEFKEIDGNLHTASHSGEGKISTYPVCVAIESDLGMKAVISLFETPIAFNGSYLFDLFNTPFNEIAINHGRTLDQMRVRNSSTGHEALLMAVDLQQCRNPLFSWEVV